MALKPIFCGWLYLSVNIWNNTVNADGVYKIHKCYLRRGK